MSSLLAETSATSPVADLHACLDRLVDHDRMSLAQHELVLADLARAKARLAAYEMKVLASADRARVGRTDLGEAVPLCHFHHQRIHDPQYEHVPAPDGSIRFRLRR